MFAPQPFHQVDNCAMTSSYLTKQILDSIKEHPNVEEAVTTFLTYITTEDKHKGDYSTPEKANISKYTAMNLFFDTEEIGERAIAAYTKFVNNYDFDLPIDIHSIIEGSRLLTTDQIKSSIRPEEAYSSYIEDNSKYKKAEEYYREQTRNYNSLSGEDYVTIYKMARYSYGSTLSYYLWSYIYH
jgi:hypothetical protein